MPRPHRRNPVQGRSAQVAIGIAMVAGVLAALGGAEPTGTRAIDVVLVVALTAVVAWASASAPWWTLAAAAAIATAAAPSIGLLVVGVVATGSALAIGAGKKNWAWVRSLSAGLTLQLLARLELGGFFGSSTLLAVTVAGGLLAIGLWRRPSAVRHRARLVGIGLVSLTAVAALGFAVAAASARSSLEEGNRQARAGLQLLNDGQLAEATTRLEAAARSFRSSDRHLGRPWTWPAMAMPGLAQHRNAAVDVSRSAAKEVTIAAEALRAIDPERLRLVNGAIDLDAVEGLEAPVLTLQAAMASLERTLEGTNSPWLVGPLQRRLDGLLDELDEYAERSDTFLAAARIAPELLGAEGPRTYFVAFTTPAEARGLGGFMGSYAELVVDGGRVEVTEFGEVHDLNRRGLPVNQRFLTGPEHFLEHYGRYGFTSATTGGTGTGAWLNVTMSPDFPTVAQVISQLYPQSGGTELDGVFALDVFALTALLELTGPITVPGVDQELTVDNAARFLLKEQYEETNRQERTEVLDSVARTTLDALLTGALPPPVDIGRVLGPMALEGRLVAWSPDPEVQDFLAGVSMDGALPVAAGSDGFAVMVNNSAANKMEAYLERDIAYDVVYDPVTGETTGELVVTFRNTAPKSGLPDYVAKAPPGYERGTSLLQVVIYTQLPVVSATLEGEPVMMVDGEELGWHRWRATVAVPPGRSERTLRLSVSGVVSAPCYRLAVVTPPLSEPPRTRISASDGAGDDVLAFDGRLRERDLEVACSGP